MNAPDRFRQGAVWSLWDIMKPFHAFVFLHAKLFLSHYANTRQLSKVPFYNLVGGMTESARIGDRQRAVYSETWEPVRGLVEELDMDASLVSIDRMINCLKDPTATYGEYWRLAAEFDGRMTDQMQNRMFLSLTLSESGMFLDPLSGWKEVVDRLPETQRDIEEARKCQALARYAAAVFHSLQVAEHGMVALGDAFGVTDPIKGWTATRNKLDSIIRKKYPDRTELEKRNTQFIEQIQATITSVNNAWRNKVSHANDKLLLLTADFTPEVTEEIITATRSLMRRLVTEGPLAP